MEKNDFFVESMRHCFICLNKISPTLKRNLRLRGNPEDESDVTPVSIYSLQTLSQYLKMNMGKVFNEHESIPQHLLDKVQKSKLKGELCDECAILNDKFAERYEKLVKIKLEMASSLKLIESKLLVATESDNVAELRHVATSLANPFAGWMKKLDVLEVLRAEAIQRCSQKLKTDIPRVKVLKLKMAEAVEERQGFVGNSTVETGINPSIEIETVSDVEMDITDTTFKIDYIDPTLGDIDNTYHSDNSDVLRSHANANHGSATPAPADKDCQVDRDIQDLQVEVSRSTKERMRKVRNGKPKQKKKDGPENLASHNLSLLPSSESAVNVVKAKSGGDTHPITFEHSITDRPNPAKKTRKMNPNLKRKKRCDTKCTIIIPPGSRKVKLPLTSLNPETGKYKCNLCPGEFKNKWSVREHHLSVHLKAEYKCNICGKVFPHRSQFCYHHKEIHADLQVTYECRVCRKTFPRKSNLTKHNCKGISS